jgi:hypothetical protein
LYSNEEEQIKKYICDHDFSIDNPDAKERVLRKLTARSVLLSDEQLDDVAAAGDINAYKLEDLL